MGKILRAVGAEDFAKLSVITARDIVERARQIHSPSPTACAALGRTLCAASMLGDMLKEDGASLTVRINGGGSIGTVMCVSDSAGNVRGYVQNPKADLPTRADGKLDVGGIVGRNGMLTVTRDLGVGRPYVGSTELVSGEIAEDFTRYFAESEQVGAACGLGVLIDTDMSVKAAGGFIVQLLPDAPESVAAKLEENIMMMDALTTILAEDGAEEVVNQVMRGLSPRILAEEQTEYRCYCSRERVLNALTSLGKDELDELSKDGRPIVAGCQFCDAEYVFSPQEVRGHIDEINNKEKM